jgi:hypothetical protein
MKAIYLFLVLMVILPGCKKSSSKPDYTVRGRLLDGTTNQPFAKVSLQLIASTDAGAINYKYDEVGSATTDVNGAFSIKYTATDITGSLAHMELKGQE